MLLLRELLDPKYGMFKYYEESRLQWFAPVVSCISSISTCCQYSQF